MYTCCAEKVVFRLACHFSSLKGFIRQNGPVREHDVQIWLAGAWQEHDCLKYPMSCLSWISCAQPSRHASVDIVGVILWCVAHSGFNRSPKGFDAGCHQLDGVFKLMCGGLILACLIVLTCIATGACRASSEEDCPHVATMSFFQNVVGIRSSVRLCRPCYLQSATLHFWLCALFHAPHIHALF